jgi:hypothetical protein
MIGRTNPEVLLQPETSGLDVVGGIHSLHRPFEKPSVTKPRAGFLQMCAGKIPPIPAVVQSETRINGDNKNVQFSLL